tara:strand:+ start:6483 stop:6854 length:372 start_codon:yes stop_codon:yes gene_type:complete
MTDNTPKKPTTSLLIKLNDKQSLLDPIIRTNSEEIPTGMYQNNKISYPYAQDTAPQGGPLETRDNKIAKFTLNQFSETFKYESYVNSIQKIPFKSNKNQLKLNLPKLNIKDTLKSAFGSFNGI